MGAPDIPQNYSFTHHGIPTAYSINAHAGMDNIKITQVPRIQTESVIRITEIPKVRVHLPLHLRIGASVLGLELFAITVCGEGQMITEDYVPHPGEQCGGAGNPGVAAAEGESE